LIKIVNGSLYSAPVRNSNDIINTKFHNKLPPNFKTDLRLDFLGLGTKFCPRPKEPSNHVYEKALTDFVSRIKIHDGVRNLPQQDDYNPKIKLPLSDWRPPVLSVQAFQLVKDARRQIQACISKRTMPLQQADRLYKYCRKIKNSPDIKIVQSDKNTGLVALHIQDYHKAVMSHLDDATIYQNIGKIDDPHWLLQLALIQDEAGDLRNEFVRSLYQTKQLDKYLEEFPESLPKFHVLPKLHKPGFSTRPIVGAPNWITTKWSILLETILEKYDCPYTLKNSQELIDKLEGQAIPKTAWLISADVSSLYTNMDLKILYKTLLARTKSRLLVKILKFICDNNYFQYGDKVYKQNNGIAMGTNVAVRCANLYLDRFDKRFAPLCHFYARYIDDIFFIFTGNIEQYIRLRLRMNNFIPGIKLSFVRNLQSVDFLDLTVTKSADDKIEFSTFRKAINVYQYLPRSSNHNNATITGYIYGEMLRQVRNNTDRELRASNIHFFYLKLRQRGFPAAYLHRIMMKVDLDKRRKDPKPDDGKKIIPFIIPFYPSALTRHLKRLLHDFAERQECTYLKIRPVLAFKRTANILQLCGGSAISAAHLRTISGDASPAISPVLAPEMPRFNLENVLDDDDQQAGAPYQNA
jgi:hypothetical protein